MSTNAQTDQYETDLDLAHQIVNGDDTSDVAVESGLCPTFRKTMKTVSERADVVLSDCLSAKADCEAAKVDVQSAGEAEIQKITAIMPKLFDEFSFFTEQNRKMVSGEITGEEGEWECVFKGTITPTSVSSSDTAYGTTLSLFDNTVTESVETIGRATFIDVDSNVKIVGNSGFVYDAVRADVAGSRVKWLVLDPRRFEISDFTVGVSYPVLAFKKSVDPAHISGPNVAIKELFLGGKSEIERMRGANKSIEEAANVIIGNSVANMTRTINQNESTNVTVSINNTFLGEESGETNIILTLGKDGSQIANTNKQSLSTSLENNVLVCQFQLDLDSGDWNEIYGLYIQSPSDPKYTFYDGGRLDNEVIEISGPLVDGSPSFTFESAWPPNLREMVPAPFSPDFDQISVGDFVYLNSGCWGIDWQSHNLADLPIDLSGRVTLILSRPFLNVNLTSVKVSNSSGQLVDFVLSNGGRDSLTYGQYDVLAQILINVTQSFATLGYASELDMLSRCRVEIEYSTKSNPTEPSPITSNEVRSNFVYYTQSAGNDLFVNWLTGNIPTGEEPAIDAANIARFREGSVGQLRDVIKVGNFDPLANTRGVIWMWTGSKDEATGKYWLNIIFQEVADITQITELPALNNVVTTTVDGKALLAGCKTLNTGQDYPE